MQRYHGGETAFRRPDTPKTLVLWQHELRYAARAARAIMIAAAHGAGAAPLGEGPMPSETLQGVVLRYTNYRERDRILTLLTPQHGRVDALSRGCRRPNSPLMPCSELFVHGEFVLFRGGEHCSLTSGAVTDTFYPLRLDAYRLTCATYMLGLIQAAAQPEQPAPGLFGLLLKALYHAAYCEDEPALAVTNTFLLLFAAETGYRPRLRHCARCRKPLLPDGDAFLDAEAGGLCCKACAQRDAAALTAAQVRWMRETLDAGFETPPQNGDTALFEALRQYVQSKLETTVKAGQLLP